MIVGREAELASVERFVGAISGGPSALVIEGEAGIGKTAIWDAGLAAARRHGHWVLSCRPSEPETKMSFAALADLLEPVMEQTLPQLPTPQARALEVALLRADADGPPPDPRALGVGVLGVLRALAVLAPVVVAIDDVQWLDAASARTLDFAFRRLEQEPIGVLVTRRIGERRSNKVLFDAAERISLGPLDADALDRVIRTQLGTGFAPPTLNKLHAASGGNPFYALEIARALQRPGVEVVPGEPLPVPPNLTELIRVRLKSFPAATRAALLAAAALSRPTRALVTAAAEGADLDQAEEAGMVALDGDRVRFTHPLLPAGLYSSTPPVQRRALHRRLAGLVEDPEEHARHLALAAQGPEEDVAAALEAAAAAARARGAPETAAALAEQAVRLTPEDCTEDIHRRRIHAAEHLVQCGDLARARGLVEQAIAALEPGPLRARGLLSLGLIQAHELGRWEDSFATDEQALREVGDDHRLRAEVERQVAWSYLTSYRASEAEPHAQAALELAERLGDRVLLAEALAAAASLEFQRGRGFRQDLVDRALALETRYEHPRVFRHPNWPLYTLRHWSGDLAGARACIEALMGLALERGEENAPPWLLGKLAAIEYTAGNWSGALSHADAAFAAAVRTGQEEPRLGALEARAWVEASAGSVEPARRKAQELLRRDDESTVICGRCLLGFIELSVGDAVSAASSLKPLLRDARRHGVEDPSVFPFWPDAIEAFISSGELGEAEPVLEWLEERGRTLDRPWALATAGRCRGLLSAAEGDLEGALAAFESALVQHERVPIPFERGRTLLAYGATQRRAKQKSLARATLSEARVVFDELGARLWTEQARAELARIGGRAPGSEELTPTERRVAELVGEGHSNKEVAAALYVGVRTVEAHLTHVYAKLGVRSRGQLARKLTRDT